MKIPVFLTTVSAALIMVCCQVTEDYGRLSISLGEGTVADVMTKGNISDYAALPTEGSFTLSVKSGGSVVWEGRLSAYDPALEFKAGNYSAEVSYGDAGAEGYEKPYFFGKADFSIVGGHSTAVNIPVSLGNSIVKINTSTAFDHYYPSRSFTIRTGAGNIFNNVTGPLFMDAYKFTITGSLTTQGGENRNIGEQTWNVDAATCYTVSFDVTNTGGATITISFDDTVQEINITEELND